MQILFVVLGCLAALWVRAGVRRVRELLEDVRSADRQAQMHHADAATLRVEGGPSCAGAIEGAEHRAALTLRVRSAAADRARQAFSKPLMRPWAWLLRAEDRLRQLEGSPR